VRKTLFLFLAAALLLPLAACGQRSSPRDFYSMAVDSPHVPVGTAWLGMTTDEMYPAVGSITNNQEVRTHLVNGVITSMTAITSYCHPVGLTWDMSRDDIAAYYKKDPAVTVDTASDPNMLTATKTIGGTLYYARIVFYSDGTVEQMNLTTDPSLDALKAPTQSGT